jgi:hypothetical protein
MSDAVDRFIADLRADARYAEHADAIEASIAALDYEAYSSPAGAGLYEALHWVIARPDRLLSEKIRKCLDLVSRRGPQSGRIKDIVGWR